MPKFSASLTMLFNELPFLKIGHVHLADHPGRHQPGSGSQDLKTLLAELDSLGYQGFVGLEYNPVPDTMGSLAWLEKFGCKL